MDVNWYIITCFIRFTSVKSVVISIVILDIKRINTTIIVVHFRVAIVFMKNNSGMI